jgi:hypothetical protein
MMQNELDAILNDETENPLTRTELFEQRKKLEAELRAAEAAGEKELLPLKKIRDEAEQKYRLAMIAHSNAFLAVQDRTNGLKNGIAQIDMTLRRSAPEKISRLLSEVHERRNAFQAWPFTFFLTRHHRSILGAQSTENVTCRPWIQASMEKFLDLQRMAEELSIAEVGDLDTAISDIFNALPNPEQAEYTAVD